MNLSDYKIDFGDKEIKYIKIYYKIKEMISNNELNSKDKLPTIRELSKVLDVNSITVVKAYELLESEGYVYKKQGSGTYVSSTVGNYSYNSSQHSYDHLYRLDSGNPSAEIFPIENFKKAINMALEEDGTDIFNYDDGNGIKELKGAMLDYLKSSSIDVDIENLMVISGAQQGIDIISKTMINYSDVVFIEEPTYSGALNVLKGRGSKLISIPLLEDGIDIGILKMKLEKLRPKMLYVMPNFQNPTGISYTEYKKKMLIELAELYDFYILEDDFISDFKFFSKNNKTLKSYDKYNRVIYIKSFSKILMPGLRVGVMVLPKELMNRALISKSSSDISTSTLIQKSLYYYMEYFNWRKHLEIVGKLYSEKFSEINKYLDYKLGKKMRIIKTNGGINFFIELKRGYYSSDFVQYMFQKGVMIKPGSAYYDNDIDDRFFRINIASETVSRIKEAIDIIAENLDDFYSNGQSIGGV